MGWNKVAVEDERIARKIDLRKVRTGEDPVRWAKCAFDLTAADADPGRTFLRDLFVALSKRGSQGGRYAVKKINARDMTPEVASLLEGSDGWEQALGFHLSREGTGASVYFCD